MSINTKWQTTSTKRSDGKDYSIPPKIASAPLPSLNPAITDLVADAEREARGLNLLGASGGMLSAIAIRMEAMKSSRIEGVPSEMKNICLAESDALSGEGNQKVKGNLAALTDAVSHTSGITTEHIKSYHREILKGEMNAGMFRRLKDGDSRVAGYLNPRGNLIEGYVNDWLAFLDRKDIPTIIRIALSHAQFNVVHPFADGNGRTSRVLIQRIMASEGWPSIPVSACYIAEKERYYETFKAYRYGDIDDLVSFHAKSVLSAASALKKYQSQCEQVIDQWESKVLEGRPRPSNLRKALEWIASNFVFAKETMARGIDVSSRTVERILGILTEAEILECNRIRREGTNKLEDRYVLSDVFKVWEEIAKTAEENMWAEYSKLPTMFSISLENFVERENMHLPSILKET